MANIAHMGLLAPALIVLRASFREPGNETSIMDRLAVERDLAFFKRTGLPTNGAHRDARVEGAHLPGGEWFLVASGNITRTARTKFRE
jgi:hypothetical protein